MMAAMRPKITTAAKHQQQKRQRDHAQPQAQCSEGEPNRQPHQLEQQLDRKKDDPEDHLQQEEHEAEDGRDRPGHEGQHCQDKELNHASEPSLLQRRYVGRGGARFYRVSKTALKSGRAHSTRPCRTSPSPAARP